MWVLVAVRLNVAVFLLLAAAACTRQEANAPSPELGTRLAAGAKAFDIDEQVWTDVQAFYSAREEKLAWSAGDLPNDRAEQALQTMRSAVAHGLDAAEYGELELTAQHTTLAAGVADASARAGQLADFDVRLTAAMLALARHVATGRQPPRVMDPRWNTRREPPDFVAALQRTWEAGGVGLLESVQPVHPEYRSLQNALVVLRDQPVAAWPAVPRASLKVGQRSHAVIPLRQRLAAGGHLPSDAPHDSPYYDAGVEAAVRAFQERHGLNASGQLDAATLTALNVPLEQRLAQVVRNLERWRWMPNDLGARHLIVNIPQYHVIARENGTPVLDIRVVVGKRGDETPTFADQMTHVVFSPYWNIPESIVIEETAPAIARDPDYLARNNMEVVDAQGRVVDESSIPWDDEEALSGYAFRQRPGATNALGLVKFMFPNRYNVYLHDTPSDALFSRIGRAFSHGCVRVEEPEKLAHYVLRGDPQWTPEAIDVAMGAGEEQHVKLPEPIPVFLVYFTAWADHEGGLHFRNDVYGYDDKQARALGRAQ